MELGDNRNEQPAGAEGEVPVPAVATMDTDDDYDDDPFAPGRLEKSCEDRAHLDGNFFSVDYTKSRAERTIVGICQFCPNNREIRGALIASSNFLKHMKRAHEEKYEQFQTHKATKRARLDTQERVQRAACKFSQRQFEINVTKYILESMVPLRTVDDPAFRKIFDDFHITQNGKPLKHLSTRTLGRRIHEEFNRNMLRVRDTIADEATAVCTTSDVWSCRNRRFIGVTVHWINVSTMERKSAAIACRRAVGTINYVKIAQNLNHVHDAFNLDPEKVVATITDNGSNFVKAFQTFGVDIADGFFYGGIVSQPADDSIEESLVEEEVQLDEDHTLYEHLVDDEAQESVLPRHLKCASHTLNLVATTDATKVIKNSLELSEMHDVAIARCTAVWKLLRSPKQNEILREVLGVALLRPVVVRWNSLYDSLKQLVSLKDKLLVGNEALNIREPLRDADFEYIEEYLYCMRPIAESIDLLQGENNCFYGYLSPTLISTRRKLHLMLHSGNVQRCAPLVEGLLDSIGRRFQKFFDIEQEGKAAAIAAVTHPLFKARWIGALTPEIQDKIRLSVISAAETEAERDHVLTPVPPAGEPEELSFFDFGENTGTFGRSDTASRDNDPEVEVLQYTKDPRTDIAMLDDYPIVKRVFVRYNTPLPSSAPVERLFSFATMMNLAKYNRLSDQKFEERVLSVANAKQ